MKIIFHLGCLLFKTTTIVITYYEEWVIACKIETELIYLKQTYFVFFKNVKYTPTKLLNIGHLRNTLIQKRDYSFVSD